MSPYDFHERRHGGPGEPEHRVSSWPDMKQRRAWKLECAAWLVASGVMAAIVLVLR